MTTKGNQGTVYVEVRSPFQAFCKEMDKAVQEGREQVNKVGAYLTLKLKEGGQATTGPLADAKKEINKLKTEVATATENLNKLGQKVNAGRSKYAVTEKNELNAHVIRKDMKEAEGYTGCCKPLVEEADAAAKELEEKAKEFTSLDNDACIAFATPVSMIEEIEKLGAGIAEKVDEARKSVKEQQQVCGKVTPATRGTAEAKKQLQSMLTKLEPISRNSAKTVTLAKQKGKVIVDKIYSEASKKMREIAQTSSITGDQFFDQLAQGSEKIADETFCQKLVGLEGLEIKPEHAKLLSKKIEVGGISRRRFLNYIQLYYAVVKSIALTDVQDIGTCKTVRKCEAEEIVEVLEGPSTDPNTGLVRVRVRSMMDRMEGWISVKGNQGTPFLQEVEKPFYTTRKEQPLDKELSGSDATRALGADEILELIEGPKNVVYPEVKRAKAKASKDGAIGWLTLKDKNEVEYAEANKKLYTIKASVAMTDGANIKDCKVVRKLAEGELFEMEGEAVEDAETPGIIRIEGVAKKDGQRGWLTSKGNAGTVYAEQTNKYYTVVKEVEMQKAFKTIDVKSEAVRTLEVGEALQITEGPKDEKVPQEIRVKVRALQDGAVGWISRKQDYVKPWTPNYKCVEKVAIHGSRVVEESTETLRELQKGETVELLEGPVTEGKALRIRCCAKKDGVVGWVTLTSEDKRFLDC